MDAREWRMGQRDAEYPHLAVWEDMCVPQRDYNRCVAMFAEVCHTRIRPVGCVPLKQRCRLDFAFLVHRDDLRHFLATRCMIPESGAGIVHRWTELPPCMTTLYPPAFVREYVV